MTNNPQQPADIAPTSRILQRPDIVDLKPRITVFGVGGGGGNAVNNMINAGLEGVEFVVANTDSQSLRMSRAERRIQLGVNVTAGLGAGSNPEIGQAAAEECLDEIIDQIGDSHMVFITCGMGGGTGTGAAPVIARAARERGILTVGVVTKPFNFERQRRMKLANTGIEELQKHVDTLIVIPNQNLFRIANETTSLVDAFAMADQVLYAGVASITDLMVREGLINLDFADVRSVMLNMGRAMMGTGEASGEGRALAAAEAAIANPLLDESSMHGARGLLISITGGRDMTLNEVDIAVTRVCDEVDPDANVIFGAILDEALEGLIRVSVVATGIDKSGEAALYTPVSTGAGTIGTAGGTAGMGSKKDDGAHEAPKGFAGHPADYGAENFNVDVMEALEEEIAESLEDDFRPQSQIFAQADFAQAEMGKADLGAEKTAASFNHSATPAKAATILAGATEPRSEAQAHSLVPDLEDFPPLIRETVSRKAENGEEGSHGPRWLLKKIAQGFAQRDEEEVMVRLEPAEIAHNMPDMAPESASEPTGAAKAALSAPTAPAALSRTAAAQSAPTRPDLFQTLPRATAQIVKPQPPTATQNRDELQDDELEIPAFLRRQVS